MYYAMRASAPSLHRESTDSDTYRLNKLYIFLSYYYFVLSHILLVMITVLNRSQSNRTCVRKCLYVMV